MKDKEKATYEELENKIDILKLEIDNLKHRPTIYEVLRMPLKGLPVKEARYYLETTLNGIENYSRVD